MAMRRPLIAAFAILACLMFAWATGAGRPYPASAGGVIDPTCTSSGPCIEYDNNGAGPGIRGISVLGNGLSGSTKNKSTFTSARAGVMGNDVGTGSFNSGVHGLSVNGTGVSGESTDATGVSGTSTVGIGVSGDAPSGVGVRGDTGDGIGVRGDAGTTGIGVFGDSTNSIAIQAVSSNFIGEQVSGGANAGGGSIYYPALSVNGNVNSSALIEACNSAGLNPCHSAPFEGVQFAVFDDGNVNITGLIRTGGSCVAGCAATASSGEKRVQLFTPQESVPTVEDFGEAQLVGGRTYVRIDPAFANTMDGHSAYMVLITPEGDSNGLYVVNKTTAGFEVHENRGGRSTLAFSYRIVGKPFGEHPVRLQMITMSRPRRSLPQTHVR